MTGITTLPSNLLQIKILVMSDSHKTEWHLQHMKLAHYCIENLCNCAQALYFVLFLDSKTLKLFFVYLHLCLYDFSRLFMCNSCYFANKIITLLQCDSYVYFYTIAHLFNRLRYVGLFIC